MRYEAVDTCIGLYRDVFDKQAARHFIEMLDAAAADDWSEIQWSNSMVGAGVISSLRTSNSCPLIPLFPPYKPTELSDFFHEHIFNYIKEVVKDYQKANLISNNVHEAFSVLRYYAGGEYHSHYDHHSTNSRVFSIVASLGEAESGGELEFPFFKKNVKLSVGDVILFPSNFPYTHIAHPVESGIKESLVSWYS